VGGLGRDIQQCEDVPNPLGHVGRQLAAVVIVIEAFQPLVVKARDHLPFGQSLQVGNVSIGNGFSRN